MKKLIFTVLLFTGALTVAAQEHIEDADAKYAADLLKPGTEAPDFVVDSVKNRSLSYYRGAYVVLDFWASWCPDCRKDIPKVQEIDSLYRDKVAVIGVSFDTNKPGSSVSRKTRCIGSSSANSRNGRRRQR